MAHLYIHPENQSILWNVLKSTPIFEFFTPYPQSKEQWFKEIIQLFYDNIIHSNFSQQNLTQLNRDTIAYMINQINQWSVKIKSKKETYKSIPNLPTTEENTRIDAINTISQSAIKSESVYNNRENESVLLRHFEERRSEYDSMLFNEAPEKINFCDTAKDTPITNIQELVQKHIQERNLETQYFPPKQDQNNNNRIIIDTSDSTQLSSDDIVLFNAEDAPSDLKKNVKWLNTQISTPLNEINQNINLEKIIEYIESLNNSIISLKNDLLHEREQREENIQSLKEYIYEISTK